MKIDLVIFILLSLNFKDFSFIFNLQLTQFALANEVNIQDVYEDCGKTRLCFGKTEQDDGDCIKTKKCEVVTSFGLPLSQKDIASTKIKGTLSESDGWIGICFSNDELMGEDVCLICAKSKDEPEPYHFLTWNEPGKKANHYIEPKDAQTTLSLKKHTSVDKELFCELESSRKIVYEGHVFDLNKDYHILMASGPGPVTNKSMPQHTSRWASKKVKLSTSTKVAAAREDFTLDKVHGILMVIGFMFFMSIGALVSRFYKQTFIEVQVCDRKFWFIVHMTCMYFALASVYIGLIMIFVARTMRKDTLFPEFGEKLANHAYVGLTVCVIMFFQTTLIWWTPKARKTLTRYHSYFGVLTFYMGWYCVTFSNKDTVRAPSSMLFYGIAWIVIYLVFFIAMTLLQLWGDREEPPEAILSDPYRALKIPMIIISFTEDPNKLLRGIALAIFVCVFLILSIVASTEIGNATFKYK